MNCVDGSDEQNCRCSDEDFQCAKSKVCIKKELRCDGREDCSDRSDEDECDPASSQTKILSTQFKIKYEQRKKFEEIHDPKISDPNALLPQLHCTSHVCPDGLCVAEENVCDDVPHCSDGSDELNC
ncbi:LDL receptor repeat-containing protein egg-1-like isoform X2 [Hyalella azteca]|uniref:LDL receptor repeat-containing protein egg-1-like isoform X2 n=1 Tax=Hyalella azteca TaxID=294128 RepID=A0A979FH17_HYAAZ|nr:LDL receptor repeat-containing protein egg-1-like isoform X2 [Hyalella azteca]